MMLHCLPIVYPRTSARFLVLALMLAYQSGSLAQELDLKPMQDPPPKPAAPVRQVPKSPAPRANPTTPAKPNAGTAKKKSTAPSASEGEAPDSFVYGHREDVMRYAAQIANDRGLDRLWVENQLSRARYQPDVTKFIMPVTSGTAKNWAAYRARFVEPNRIRAGLQWSQIHAQTLAQASNRYGVPADIIVAIVGIESYYGRMTGRYRVLDALATLAFDFPAGRSDRSEFYRAELRSFLVWCALDVREPDSVLGSYAGAIGWPQFMPSSIMKYAVDFDQNAHVDLADGGPDVIGSVANYLAQFGWQRDTPTYFEVKPPPTALGRARLLAPDITPSFSAAEMTAAGAELSLAGRAYKGPLALVELQNGEAPPSYVAGTQNFYAITRYNWSSYYALAVIELAQALRHARVPESNTNFGAH